MLRQGLSNGIQLGMWPFQWLVNAHFKSYIEIRRLEIWLSRCLVNNKAGFFKGKISTENRFAVLFSHFISFSSLSNSKNWNCTDREYAEMRVLPLYLSYLPWVFQRYPRDWKIMSSFGFSLLQPFSVLSVFCSNFPLG